MPIIDDVRYEFSMWLACIALLDPNFIAGHARQIA